MEWLRIVQKKLYKIKIRPNGFCIVLCKLQMEADDTATVRDWLTAKIVLFRIIFQQFFGYHCHLLIVRKQ